MGPRPGSPARSLPIPGLEANHVERGGAVKAGLAAERSEGSLYGPEHSSIMNVAGGGGPLPDLRVSEPVSPGCEL